MGDAAVLFGGRAWGRARLGKPLVGAVSANPLSEQVKEERWCPHPNLQMLECRELSQVAMGIKRQAWDLNPEWLDSV